MSPAALITTLGWPIGSVIVPAMAPSPAIRSAWVCASAAGTRNVVPIPPPTPPATLSAKVQLNRSVVPLSSNPPPFSSAVLAENTQLLIGLIESLS